MASRKESSNVVLSIRSSSSSRPGTGLSFYLKAVPIRNFRAFEIIAVALSLSSIEKELIPRLLELWLWFGPVLVREVRAPGWKMLVRVKLVKRFKEGLHG